MGKRAGRLLILVLCLGVLGMVILSRMHDTAATIHPHEAELKHADGSWKYTNALAGETSPYLLQHAHNPVDWHPWGDAAFDKARREQKPIFLSVGYSTCYWCHVMERQVFENPAIAAQMNQHFISIKVDREERPDVDDIYMTATQLLTRRGGWPMSVFLTPPPPPEGEAGQNTAGYGLKPFFAGTYFPPEPQHGLPGFPQVIAGIADAWTNQREKVLESAENIAGAVSQVLGRRDDAAPVSIALVQTAANGMLRSFDPEHGGFGSAPKFPTPVNVSFLLAVQRHTGDASVREAIDLTLDRMARGGMYDQVGGGFHRYSTDERWLVPHFEKMLYDNGLLAELYADALRDAEDEHRQAQYRRVLREVGDYVIREMTDATGAFWSAQDAEVDAREGGSYLWTADQVRDAIDDEALTELALKMYGLDRGANFTDPHDPEARPQNVLYLPVPLHELAGDAIQQKRQRINVLLKAVRDKRQQPGTDDKVLVAWNGMMIAGMSAISSAVDDPQYADAAERAADAIVTHMTAPDGGLYRSMRRGEAKIPAFLDDYAFFIHGLIALHRAGRGDGRYLDMARRYTDIAIERFAAPHGGYYDTLADQADLFVRTRSTYDGATPSGNSRMIHNLIDLHELTGDEAYLHRAATDLRSFAAILNEQGQGMLHMQHALLRVSTSAPASVTALLAAPPSAPKEQPVRATLRFIDDRRFEVRIAIDDGYHINAHEPSDDWLIPTTLELTEGDSPALDVQYPEPVMRQYRLAPQPLSVYEGEVVITGALPTAHDNFRGRGLVLQYQACTETQCLAPKHVVLAVSSE